MTEPIVYPKFVGNDYPVADTVGELVARGGNPAKWWQADSELLPSSVTVYRQDGLIWEIQLISTQDFLQLHSSKELFYNTNAVDSTTADTIQAIVAAVFWYTNRFRILVGIKIAPVDWTD